MLAIKLMCPGCGAVLKLAAVHEGKRVRCPRCGVAFRTAARQAPAPARPAPERVAAEALLPAPLRPTPLREELVPAPLPPPLSVAIALPVPPICPTANQARPRKRLLLVGLAALGILVLAAVSFGFYRLTFSGSDQASGGGATVPSNSLGSGEMSPLNYLPADCNCLMGVQFGPLANESEVVRLVERLPRHTFVLTANTYMRFRTAQEFQEHFGFRYEDVEWIVAGLRMDSLHRDPSGSPEVTLVIRTRPAYDRDKILKAYDAISTTPEKWPEGQDYYELQPQPRGPTFMHLPNEHLIVLSNVPPERRDSVLRLDGKKPVLSAPLLTLADRLGRFPVWMVLPFDQLAREMPLDGAPAEYRDVLTEIKGVKLLALWARPSGSEAELHAGMQCADGSHASTLASGLRRLWEKELKPELEHHLGEMPPALQEAVRGLRDTLTITTDGDLAVLSARLKFASISRIMDQAWGNGK